jgi:SAM-dependent methyltransferase
MPVPRQARLSKEEIDREVTIANEIVTRSIGAFLKTLDLVSESNLAQVLIALWDSGLYEYVRQFGRLEIRAVAAELGLDAEILLTLVEYLVGRRLMNFEDGAFVLSDKGQVYWNYVTRGAVMTHLGGYNPLMINLGPLLRKEIDINEPRLDRVGRIVALGAGQTLLGNGTVPWIRDMIGKFGGKCVLDLGCGAGVFLTQLALKWPQGRGIGIDMNADAIAEARAQALADGVADRVEFHVEKLTDQPLTLSTETIARVDVVTAMFILHEFGGCGGVDAIASVIRSLRKHFPGRKLLMAEGTRADPYDRPRGPVRNHAQLDYSLIHPLSRQGPLRTPDEWRQIIESAGARLLDRQAGFKLVPSWINVYVVDLD